MFCSWFLSFALCCVNPCIHLQSAIHPFIQMNSVFLILVDTKNKNKIMKILENSIVEKTDKPIIDPCAYQDYLTLLCPTKRYNSCILWLIAPQHLSILDKTQTVSINCEVKAKVPSYSISILLNQLPSEMNKLQKHSALPTKSYNIMTSDVLHHVKCLIFNILTYYTTQSQNT